MSYNIFYNLRTSNKMSQRALADAIGIQHTYISRIEHGYIPSYKTVLKYSTYFNIPVAMLLEEQSGITSCDIAFSHCINEFFQKNTSPSILTMQLQVIRLCFEQQLHYSRSELLNLLSNEDQMRSVLSDTQP